jgi:hypothetical protein
MPKPKITKAERLVQEQMIAMLEWVGSPRPLAQHRETRSDEEGGGAAREARRNRDLPGNKSVSTQTEEIAVRGFSKFKSASAAKTLRCSAAIHAALV